MGFLSKTLFGSKPAKAARSGEVRELAPNITAAILSLVGGSKAIPPMPAAAQKAFQLSIDPNAEARDFIDVIESDESLSARVLRIANSVFFDRGKKSSTIEEAVIVIGINELRCLLNSNTLSEIFPSKHPARAHLWAHDIATALISKSIAQRLKPAKADFAFLAGLMHDIGKLLLLQRNKEEFEKIVKLVENQGMTFCEAEASLFPFDHTDIGQLIAQRWHFGGELTAAIKLHHLPWDDGEISIAQIVKAADIIAHSLGLGHPRTFNRFRLKSEEELPAALSRIGISETDRKGALDNFRRQFEGEFELYSGQAES
ncbi:MAG: hypothetical protein DCC75_08525 [Proteobacteria bacterium]|nr:MAG: hypothetical protein DCC75_08525 [Pseudomonadota bacterium]